MAFAKLITLFTFASLATGQSESIQTASIQTQPSLTKVLLIPEYVQKNVKPEISYTLQLPRQEDPVPFYYPEITSDLQPPSNVEPNGPNFFVEYPVPSLNLQVPAVGPWNPTGDPAMYYDVIVDLSQQKQPTGKYPKKFNKEDKKGIQQPKQEIEVNPSTVEEFSQQIKAIDKIEKLANKRAMRNEKTQQTVQV